MKISRYSCLKLSYRLAPENKYPIPIDDSWMVTSHIMNHADEFKIDIDRLVLAGDSAGVMYSFKLTKLS